ncbi:hypothetical protein HDV62DRAFT_395354 [Trichoderma sp. SZMC 28011]
MAHYPPACQPGHSQPAALPPRPASSQSQPVPSGQNEPTAKIAAGNRSTGCWAAPGITDRFGPQAVCQPNQWAANDDTRPPPKDPQETQDARALATSRPHCNIERLESLRFFGTCGAHPGSVAQVLVAKGREVRTSCPRRRWRMEVPHVPITASIRTETCTVRHSIRGYEDSMGPDKTSEPRREGPDG